MVAFRLEREPLRGLVLLPLQQIVYRQLMYAVLIQSVSSAVAGTRLRWQKIPRAGLFSAAPRIALRRGRRRGADHGADPGPGGAVIAPVRLLPVLLARPC